MLLESLLLVLIIASSVSTCRGSESTCSCRIKVPIDCIASTFTTYELNDCCKHDSGSVRWSMIACEVSERPASSLFLFNKNSCQQSSWNDWSWRHGVTIKIMNHSYQEGIMVWRADRWSMWSPCSYQSSHFWMEYITRGNERTGHTGQFLRSNLLTLREIPWKAFVMLFYVNTVFTTSWWMKGLDEALGTCLRRK